MVQRSQWSVDYVFDHASLIDGYERGLSEVQNHSKVVVHEALNDFDFFVLNA